MLREPWELMLPGLLFILVISCVGVKFVEILKRIVPNGEDTF
jgi:hypothetical protein